MSLHSNEYKNLMLPSEQNIKLALSKYEKIFPSSSGPSKTKKNNLNLRPSANSNKSTHNGHALLKKLREVIKINPFHWDANFNIAFILTTLEKPQFKKSLYHIHLCLDLKPLSWRCYHLMCIIYIGMGVIDKAHDVCKRGLSMHPGCGALHEQEQTIHILMERRKLRTEIGQHGEGPLKQYNDIISEKMKLALLNVLNGIRHSSIDPRDPDSLGNIAHNLLNIDGKTHENEVSKPPLYPPVVNLIRHYGPRKYECQNYYESTIYHREIEDILKIGRRGIKAIQWRHILERNTKINAWHQKKKAEIAFEERKQEQKAREEKAREEKLRILGLTSDERIDYKKKKDNVNNSDSEVVDVDVEKNAIDDANLQSDTKEEKLDVKFVGVSKDDDGNNVESSGNREEIETISEKMEEKEAKVLRLKKAGKEKNGKRNKSKSYLKRDAGETKLLENSSRSNVNTNIDAKDAKKQSGEEQEKEKDDEEENCPEYPVPKYILFMDVDDTIFSTYNFMKNNRMNTIPIFELDYLLELEPDIIKPMLKFYEWLVSKGNINIVFISERPFYARPKLEIALRNSGFGQYHRLYCRDSMHQPSKYSAKDFKRKIRRKILKELKEKYGLKYRIFIIGEVGDQASDFIDDEDGNDLNVQKQGIQIKLPNYLYTVK
jgi:hypothetical protein